MAQNDETDQHPGADSTSPEASAAATPAPVESTEPADEPATALRSSLPMRKAGTMPDLSRFEGRTIDGDEAENDPHDRESATAEPADSEPSGGLPAEGQPAGGQREDALANDVSANDTSSNETPSNDTLTGRSSDAGGAYLFADAQNTSDTLGAHDADDSHDTHSTAGNYSTVDSSTGGHDSTGDSSSAGHDSTGDSSTLPGSPVAAGTHAANAAAAGPGTDEEHEVSLAHNATSAETESSESETVESDAQDVSEAKEDPESHSSTATAVAAPVSAAAVASAGTEDGSRTSSDDAESAPYDPEPETAALSTRASEEEARRRAAERDGALTGKPVMARVFQVLIAIFFPIILLAGAIRAVTSPLFLWVEYHRPGFPADGFGFNTEDRMTYGSYTVDYILNWAPPRYLGELVNADGDQLFLDSEVGHMLDVKLVLVISFAVALAMLVFTIAACWHLARTYPGGVRRSLFAGALTTLVLMIALTVTAILGWQTFFTQVHALFFADGTWTFSVDDTLIRLFPAQFWMDAAITVAALVLIVSVVTLILTWPTKARRQKSRLAADAARQRQMDSLSL
ncbi:TIGR01906 family membrane protein [Arthrobacter sp. CAN_C5]|uniref:TIGR01906 family membrane protein n=1 Tax=Arthrobacter sp. CAN_C5 TaxID=2760706 RepID=UPI0028A83F37|nr:TIGR01906 family membrane protein [Arthrobacter sp. CAN_C5]MBP2217774.1 integral membrane protein (TIGR01906 family) [Arthrobacter sp. CAN_C5]